MTKKYQSKLTDEQVLKIFRKYEKDIFDTIKQAFRDDGCSISRDFDYEGILEEAICGLIRTESAKNLVDGIADSIGCEAYGVNPKKEYFQ